MKKILLFLYVITISLMGYSQHTLVLNPVSDCYVVTYGGGMGKNSFLKFNITSIPSDAVITSTKLRAFVTNTSPSWDGDLRIVHYTNQTWLEGDSNKVLWQLIYLADTTVQLSGFGTTAGWAETIDIKPYLNVDFQAPHTFFSVMLKDVDDPTMAPNMSGVSINDNDSMMIGNIFNDNIVFRPREWVNAPPQLVIDYGIPPTIQPLSPISPVCQGSTVILSITATGDPTLLYQWKYNGVDITGANSSSYTIPSAQVSNTGNYTCVVTNTFGTATSGIIALVVNANPTITISSTNITCNGACNGTATVSASGGTVPLTYLWSNLSTTPTITNLCPGTYSPTVIDANGCSATGSVTISQPAAITVSVSHTNVLINGQCTGTATVSLSGGTPGYTLLWSIGAVTSTITNLCAGTYCVTVTDSQGCTATGCAVISQPLLLTISTTHTNVTCNGLCNGTATVTPSGGVPAYLYNWSPVGTNPSAMCAGTYGLTVTDANGATATTSVIITQPAALTVSVTSQTPVTCNGACNGTATITMIGGTTPYSINWSNGVSFNNVNLSTSTINGLCAGNYFATITDANACTAVTSVTITQPAALNVSVTSTNVSCFGLCDGTATLNVTGGTAPYMYLWSNVANSNPLTGLCAGVYCYTVTDANFCTATGCVTITQPSQLFVNVVTTNVSCNGFCDGTATLNATGGTPAYTYLWCNGEITANSTNLCAGSCIVTITDANSCYTVTFVTINEPPQLISTISSNDDNGTGNGTATIVVSGGIPTYTYIWDDPLTQITATAINLVAGLYHVTATDANGCTIIDTVEVLLNTGIYNSKSDFNLSLFPNPVKDNFNLSITTYNNNDISINIYNNIGELVFNKDLSLTIGNSLQLIDMRNYTPGVYFVKLISKNNTSFLKFIKTE
ncbi:MAG: T9SS type A sorting domain-containing protein [Bacteroidia bacterium]|nr:T9SS type A sorting domain-containing protein [Bacteroidia bacterium]